MTLAFNPTTATGVVVRAGIAMGTEVLTQLGLRQVETLRTGDKVVTRDHGFQVLRGIGRVTLSGVIQFDAGALGAHGAITLAPETRVLIRNPLAKPLSGNSGVFARACDLVNSRSIRVLEGAPVQMLQLLFDQHEILRAAEMEVESLQPEAALMRQLDAETRAAIARLLPTAAVEYGPAARPCLRPSEARQLSAAQ
jgi:hypothetical protein